MMKNKFYVLLAITLVLSHACYSGSKHSKELKWHKFGKAVKLSKKYKKPLIIDFYTDWCKWCKVMDEKTYENPKVKKYLKKHFILARIDGDNATDKHRFAGREFTERELAYYFRVQGYPSTAFLTSKQEVLGVVAGYIPAEKFIVIAKYIGSGAYKKMKFDEYIKRYGK